MEKKHIITINGSLGSGKSSTAKRIAEILNYRHVSGGDFMRSLAAERNVSLEELSAIAETDPSIDEALDEQNRKIGEKSDIIIDSRLGFHFIPQSFKVLLTLDPAIAAQRILADSKVNPNRQRETRDAFDTVENIINSIEERLASERKRYKELYGIADHRNPKNFDLVINTSDIPLEVVSQKIIEEYKKWLAEK
ncbi:MAG: cytidylate kinase family protein [Patescibacteria group bacterium]